MIETIFNQVVAFFNGLIGSGSLAVDGGSDAAEGFVGTGSAAAEGVYGTITGSLGNIAGSL